METSRRGAVIAFTLVCCGVVSVAALSEDSSSTVETIEGPDQSISLIAEDSSCAGAACGLCNQPCAQTCCEKSATGKPECCSQQETPIFKIPYIPPRAIPSTACPPCNLCRTILSQPYVDPGLAQCCNAVPCGSKKMIDNSIPDPPKDRNVTGINPYGANWTYEKHVKKNGVDTTKFENASNIVKAAVADAAKQAQDIALEMTKPLASDTSNSSANTSWVPGIPVVLMPPGVNISNWTMSTADLTAETAEILPTQNVTENNTTYVDLFDTYELLDEGPASSDVHFTNDISLSDDIYTDLSMPADIDIDFNLELGAD